MTSCVLPLLIASLGVAPKGQIQQLPCPRPPSTTYRAPQRGFVEVGGSSSSGTCDVPAADAWTVARTPSFALFVHADGPGGSGRYWTVTVGVGPPDAAEPRRGFCLVTTTIAWRRLIAGLQARNRQESPRTPLRWLEDADGDGRPELVLWDSFRLSDEALPIESGLVAWVYEADSAGWFAIDWSATHALARELALLYARADPMGQALEALARGACMPARRGLRRR